MPCRYRWRIQEVGGEKRLPPLSWDWKFFRKSSCRTRTNSSWVCEISTKFPASRKQKVNGSSFVLMPPHRDSVRFVLISGTATAERPLSICCGGDGGRNSDDRRRSVRLARSVRGRWQLTSRYHREQQRRRRQRRATDRQEAIRARATGRRRRVNGNRWTGTDRATSGRTSRQAAGPGSPERQQRHPPPHRRPVRHLGEIIANITASENCAQESLCSAVLLWNLRGISRRVKELTRREIMWPRVGVDGRSRSLEVHWGLSSQTKVRENRPTQQPTTSLPKKKKN